MFNRKHAPHAVTVGVVALICAIVVFFLISRTNSIERNLLEQLAEAREKSRTNDIDDDDDIDDDRQTSHRAVEKESSTRQRRTLRRGNKQPQGPLSIQDEMDLVFSGSR